MTTIARIISNDEYCDMISNDPLAYFDEFLMNLDDDLFPEDIDSWNPDGISLEEETEKISSSSKVEQYSLKVSSIQSPQTTVQSVDLICMVCSASAHGYNFDQITCESCKAFFRRNAFKNMSTLKCRFSGCCVINVHTRRQCTYCRLKKCFDINMRKDWIRTDEERELRRLKNLQKEQRKQNKLVTDHPPIVNLPIVMRKKKRIIPLTAKPSTIKPITQELIIQRVEPIYKLSHFGIHRNLSNNDKILLNNIISAYKYGADQADFSHITRYTSSSSSLAQFINNESVNHKSLIYFYKHIPEFRQFDIDDQVLLIKCNMIDIIHLHHIIIQNFHEIPQIATHMSQWITEDFHQQMSKTRQRFDRFMKYPLVLQITLIVFVFSINLSTPSGSSQFTIYKNKRQLYENQNVYTSLLWRYLNYLFDEKEAIRSMQIIVMQILRYQLLMVTMGEALQKSGQDDIFEPLMRSIFGLT